MLHHWKTESLHGVIVERVQHHVAHDDRLQGEIE